METDTYSLRHKKMQPNESSFSRYQVYQHIRKESPVAMALNETRGVAEGR